VVVVLIGVNIMEKVIDYIRMHTMNIEWATINLAWATWTWAMFSNAITWILGVIGAITLIWFNVERALTARKERELLKSKHNEKTN
jgi:hypothetical protein